MKRLCVMLIALFLGTLPFVTEALAAKDKAKNTTGPSSKNLRNVAVKSSTIIGKTVKNPEDEKLGKIEDLVIDTREGTIAYAVLSAGGFLGMGDKFFAIPWKAFRTGPDGDTLILAVDKELLKNAPGFDKNNWPDMTDRRWGANIYKYYGQRPYWERRRG